MKIFVAGPMSAPAPKSPDAVPVLVDTDLAPDDLAALALLARHPDVDVVAITVPGTGELGCVGRGLVADLFEGLRMPPPSLACGDTPRGPGGTPFPQAWMVGSIDRSGLPGYDVPTSLTPVESSATELIARTARRHDGLQVVALAPLTEVAGVLRRHPSAYARLGGITVMAGAVDSVSHTAGVAEWNAGANPLRSPRSSRAPCPWWSCPTTRYRGACRTVWPARWWAGSAGSPASSPPPTGTSPRRACS